MVIALLAEIASLDGLAPSTMPCLSLLARHPVSAARLALSAEPDDRGAVLDLAERLPLVWCAIPFQSWARAADLRRASLQRILGPHLGDGATELARSAVADSVRRLVIAEPFLKWPFFAAGLVHDAQATGHGAKEAAIDHVRRHGHAAREAVAPSLFRLTPGHGLPAFLASDFHPCHLETLDAPCAAATAAAGRRKLEDPELLRIGMAARFDPTYFEEAFVAHFIKVSRGGA